MTRSILSAWNHGLGCRLGGLLLLPDLMRLASTSKSVQVALDEASAWRKHLGHARDEAPHHVRALQAIRTRVFRRKNEKGRVLRMKKAEKRAFDAVNPRELLTDYCKSQSAAWRSFERTHTSTRDMASFYPRGLCRACGRLSKTHLMWHANCKPCFLANDAECTLEECNRMGITFAQRKTIPFRWNWCGFRRTHRYRRSDLNRFRSP